ncbi:MAG: hypothetical protein HKN29_11130 [Rhodothermales bacterium]|nr:hypothetical protein [Rhodothermales bacterium]
MFNAAPHPADDGFVAVQETYSRTVIFSPGYSPAMPPRQRDLKPRIVSQGVDRHPSPNRSAGSLQRNPERPSSEQAGIPPVVAVVGANATSREHTLATRVADCLANRGLRVAVSRLTGGRRTVFRESCNWVSAVDLADYGYVSTQTCDPRELSRLFRVQMDDLAASTPDVVVVELCGTLWRQDVRAMVSLIGQSSGPRTSIISASDPGAAALGIEMVNNSGLNVGAIWTPRADSSSLRRDRRIRRSGVTVCGRGDTACAARALMDQLKTCWVPLDNGLFYDGTSVTSPLAA